MAGEEVLRELLADDHEVFRLGLARALHEADGFEPLLTDSSTEAVRLAAERRPDLVVLEIDLGPDGGVTAARRILAADPDARVLVLTDRRDTDAVLSAIAAGAAGYLLKRTSVAGLLEAFHRVASGEDLLDPAVTAPVLDRLRRAGATDPDERMGRLSLRELEVLAHVAEGRSNREIADALFVSEKTVKNHLTHILAKLGIQRRTEAAARYHRYIGRFGA
jgi:DNA-binding NarL/FixJ family response regulator